MIFYHWRSPVSQSVSQAVPQISATRRRSERSDISRPDIEIRLPGGAPRSGRGGRRFKSCHSDQHIKHLADPEKTAPRKLPKKNPTSSRAHSAFVRKQRGIIVGVCNWARALDSATAGNRKRDTVPDSQLSIVMAAPICLLGRLIIVIPMPGEQSPEAVPKAFNPGLGIATADRHDAFVGATDAVDANKYAWIQLKLTASNMGLLLSLASLRA
jgi:hypothetical protein